MPTDVRAPASARGEVKSAPPAATVRNNARTTARKGEETPAVAAEPVAETESPLTGFLRRALNQPPPAEEGSESVKP
jgi:hypothetical protein